MATELQHTVKPSGGDYTTLDAAIDHLVASHANLVGSDNYATIAISGSWSSSDTAQVTINGLTLDATRYLKIYTDAANHATASGWKTDRYNLSVTSTQGIFLYDDYVQLDGLQIEVPSGNANEEDPIYVSGQPATNNLLKFSNCRIRVAAGAGTTVYGIGYAHLDPITQIWNTIFEAHPSNAGTIRGIYCVGATTTVYQSIFYGFNRGVMHGAGTTSVYDSCSFSNDDDFQGSPTTVDYCASDDGDGTNAVDETAGGTKTWADCYTDAANGDFTTKAGSPLIGTSSRAGSGVFSDDMDGTARGAAWDLGASEYVAPPVTGMTNDIVMIFEC